MTMRQIDKTVSDIIGTAVMASADTINKENHPAWTMSLESLVDQLMMVGTMGHSFYSSQKELVAEAIELLNVVANKQPELLAQAIVKGRNTGFIRTAPIMGLAILSCHTEGKEWFKKIFNDVIHTGNDMEDFISMCRALDRGFGRAIKSAMENWAVKKVSPFYAMKYTRQIVDMVRLSRFNTADPIYDYLFNATGVKKDVEKFDRALETYPSLKGYEGAKKALSNQDWDSAMRLINEHKLDPLSLTGVCNPPKKVWLVLAEQMGVMAYLKYLNKLIAEDAISEEVLKAKITVENLKRAKVFPFRLWVAYHHITESNFVSEMVKEHLASTLDAYITAYDWEKWRDKRVVVAPDISGSMGFPEFKGIKRGRVHPIHVAGMFSGILYKGLQNCLLLPWGDKVMPYKVPKTDSILTHINAISAMSGGTAMDAPVKELLRKKIVCDILIVITDSEEWSGRTPWFQVWCEYKRTIAKNARAFMIRVDPYKTQPFPEAEAEKWEIYQIFTWSDSAIDYINYQL